MDSPTAEEAGPRRATTADVDPVRAVIDAAYRRYVPRMDRLPAPMVQDIAPRVEAGTVWVVGDPICGLICLTVTDDALLVETVAVHPDVQGTGLGRQLLDFAEQEARRSGLRRLRLYTNEVMTENLALYAHLGYQESHRGVEDGYRRVHMEKVLARLELDDG
jgi:GNAT superfamily N-acetyltransferase